MDENTQEPPAVIESPILETSSSIQAEKNDFEAVVEVEKSKPELTFQEATDSVQVLNELQEPQLQYQPQQQQQQPTPNVPPRAWSSSSGLSFHLRRGAGGGGGGGDGQANFPPRRSLNEKLLQTATLHSQSFNKPKIVASSKSDSTLLSQSKGERVEIDKEENNEANLNWLKQDLVTTTADAVAACIDEVDLLLKESSNGSINNLGNESGDAQILSFSNIKESEMKESGGSVDEGQQTEKTRMDEKTVPVSISSPNVSQILVLEKESDEAEGNFEAESLIDELPPLQPTHSLPSQNQNVVERSDTAATIVNEKMSFPQPFEPNVNHLQVEDYNEDSYLTADIGTDVERDVERLAAESGLLNEGSGPQADKELEQEQEKHNVEGGLGVQDIYNDEASEYDNFPIQDEGYSLASGRSKQRESKQHQEREDEQQQTKQLLPIQISLPLLMTTAYKLQQMGNPPAGTSHKRRLESLGITLPALPPTTLSEKRKQEQKQKQKAHKLAISLRPTPNVQSWHNRFPHPFLHYKGDDHISKEGLMFGDLNGKAPFSEQRAAGFRVLQKDGRVGFELAPMAALGWLKRIGGSSKAEKKVNFGSGPRGKDGHRMGKLK
ncbi:hypothetical protein BDR26DRAFT_866255 [Obelidium mucronatum]|nr:hypothetical protein BDR26DRAFT_866255 [Obelidium mucronatum]